PYDHPDDNHVMEDVLAYYKQIIALRNAHSALRTGRFLSLLADDDQDVWAFERADDTETLIVALNASGEDREVRIPLPAGAADRWGAVYGEGADVKAADGAINIRVPAIGGVVLKAR
ncbi:MAG: alpha-glucosidase C-terminal domain-containing protein, partial [Phycisphaerales bacterium]|nr:alpha-glucosidase C-terminal domain-containing protein [Phycisphaerales bacterium]